MGYMVVDQTPFTVPSHANEIKRPDFLVGILSVGLVAIDVKGRSPVDGAIIIERAEFEGFTYFERYFGAPVWYVCYPERTSDRCLLFRNADLMRLPLKPLNRRHVYAVPLSSMTNAFPHDETFDTALLAASRVGQLNKFTGY